MKSKKIQKIMMNLLFANKKMRIKKIPKKKKKKKKKMMLMKLI